MKDNGFKRWEVLLKNYAEDETKGNLVHFI